MGNAANYNGYSHLNNSTSFHGIQYFELKSNLVLLVKYACRFEKFVTNTSFVEKKPKIFTRKLNLRVPI